MKRTHLLLLAVLLVNLAGCGGTTDPSVATSVTLSPTTLSFSSLGDTEQLTATVRDQDGATISGASITWTSSSSSVASVSSTGLVAAVADGTATITATSGTASGTASVTVVIVCSTSTVSVTATVDVSGTAPVFDWVPDCAVSWVLVEGVTGGDVWWIIGDLSPPITYGTTPAGSVTFTGPLPLVRGRSYFFVQHVIDPSQPLPSWDLPEPDEVGSDWAPAACLTLQSIRLRLSEDYWKARVKEAYRQRKANPPREPELTETEQLIIEHAEELSADERNEAG